MNRLILSIIALCSFSLWAEERVDISEPNFDGQSFGAKSYWYIGNESIESIASPQFQEKFSQGKNERLSFGTSSEVFWINISLVNPLSSSKKLFIWDSSNFAEEVSVFRGNQLIRNLSHRDVLRQRIVELDLAPNSSTEIYIKRLAYGSQRQTWTFWLDRDRLIHEIRDHERNWALTMTVFAMSLLFNVMLYFSYRLKMYLYYIAYLVTWAAWSSFILAMIGSFYSVEMLLILSLLSQICVVLFSMEFLNLKTEFPKSYYLLLALTTVSALSFPITFFDAYLSFRLGIFFNGPGSLVLFLIAINVYAQTRKFHVLIYLIAYGTFLSGIMVLAAMWKGLLPHLAGHENLTLYTAAIEDILLLLAMGYKIYGTEKERLKNHKELKHSYSQLAKVFYPHQLKAIQSGKSLETTMPIDNKRAAVIAFDVIESSKVGFEGFKNALESFFGRCRAAIYEEYNPETMSANGYIIKEMGDGLLCSVGFPFKATRDEQKCLCAVELGERFIAEFIDTMQSFALSEPIYCAVGIAYDNVEGFFSESGVVKYDLFGRGLTLATRYESSRRAIFEKMNIDPSNLLILQHKVYESLPAEKKNEYILINLKKEGITIKDDETATHLAFRRIESHFLVKTAV